jgi:hypothetical protein
MGNRWGGEEQQHSLRWVWPCWLWSGPCSSPLPPGPGSSERGSNASGGSCAPWWSQPVAAGRRASWRVGRIGRQVVKSR